MRLSLGGVRETKQRSAAIVAPISAPYRARFIPMMKRPGQLITFYYLMGR